MIHFKLCCIYAVVKNTTKLYNFDKKEIQTNYKRMIIMDILSSFGKRISEIRKSKGISQENFALKIGMDRAYYSSIENGKHSVSLEKIKLIADGLEISISKLFEGI